MAKHRKNKLKKTKKGLTLHASGQYRMDVDGRTIYFGSDPKEADKRYDLYQITKLCWSRNFRQFVKEIAGTVRAFGKTVEDARVNYERLIADNWQNGPEPEPAPVISNNNISIGLYDVKTVRDAANAYVNWCFENRSEKHALDAKRVFKHFACFVKQDTSIFRHSNKT